MSIRSSVLALATVFISSATMAEDAIKQGIEEKTSKLAKELERSKCPTDGSDKLCIAKSMKIRRVDLKKFLDQKPQPQAYVHFKEVLTYSTYKSLPTDPFLIVAEALATASPTKLQMLMEAALEMSQAGGLNSSSMRYLTRVATAILAEEKANQPYSIFSKESIVGNFRDLADKDGKPLDNLSSILEIYIRMVRDRGERAGDLTLKHATLELARTRNPDWSSEKLEKFYADIKKECTSFFSAYKSSEGTCVKCGEEAVVGKQ